MDLKISKYALQIQGIFQWPELFKYKEWNWINFTPIQLSFEAGRYKGAYAEVTLVVLGIGFWAEIYNDYQRKGYVANLQDRLSDEFISMFRNEDGPVV